MAKSYSIIWIYHILSTYLQLIDIGLFLLFDCFENAAMKLVYRFLHGRAFIPLGYPTSGIC